MDERDSSAVAIVLASGTGSRAGGAINKVYQPLAGRPVLAWSLSAFRRTRKIGLVLLVCRPEDEPYAIEAINATGENPGGAPIVIIHGGNSRHESELLALRHLADRINRNVIDVVLVHDGARPFVSESLINAVLTSAVSKGSGVPGVKIEHLVSVGDGNHVTPFSGAQPTVSVQTPQGFHAKALFTAYDDHVNANSTGTDTAGFVEQFSLLPIHLVAGDKRNFKITYPHDLVIAHTLIMSGDS